MRFRFCGDADCPDWVLAEINTLSRLSSVKLKLLGRLVGEGLVNPPLDMAKAEKLFADSKLDPDVDLKTCVACLTFVVLSTTRFNCDHAALLTELQQLGLPREHSTSVKKILDECGDRLAAKLKASSLKVNRLEAVQVHADKETNTAVLDVTVDGSSKAVVLSPLTVDVLLHDLKLVKARMGELVNSPYSYT